ncbi:calcium load-activated calcium channel [Manacus vitellinus]|nr:calcium load-activated calcium channel [Manacus vitellinus]
MARAQPAGGRPCGRTGPHRARALPARGTKAAKGILVYISNGVASGTRALTISLFWALLRHLKSWGGLCLPGYLLFVSGITWVLVYRTDKYKRLKAEVEKQSKKLEKKKETITESAGRQQKKKIERQEEKLKNNNRDLSMVRMKSMFAIGFCFTALMGMFNSIFDGRVVAKLPFIPLSYIQGLSHRNLLGEDYTDCSFIFLYILCTMSIRQNIQKMLGLAPSRAATKQAGGFLGPPPQAGKFS